MRNVLKGYVSMLNDHKKLRFFHFLTGDSVQTNEAALRRVSECMDLFAQQFLPLLISYFLISWLCAAHQAV